MRTKLTILLALMLAASACTKHTPQEDPSPSDAHSEETLYYANMFAFNMMNGYYLWRDDMVEEIESWTYEDDPVQKVADLRYRDSSGKLIDKWTRMMEDMRPFEGSVTGNTESFGFDFILYYATEDHSKVCIVVTFTYAGSPAAQVLRRGDVILSLDGTEMTPDNYQDLIRSKLNSGGTVKLGMLNGNSKTLTSSHIYENPVHTVRTFEFEGRKIAYLHYTGFTPRSASDLVPVFIEFGGWGAQELVLDLRYNGGGYMTTCTCLASLIAPAEVLDNEVFIKEVYNSRFEEEETLFKSSLSVSDGETTYLVDVSQAHAWLNLERVWIITGGSSASASETLICGLKPYMDVHTVGQKTYGKFCGGYLISTESFYSTLAKQEGNNVDCTKAIAATENWGIYVMASRYTDCNGVTLSMPDGIPADYEAHDNPMDGHELGDPSETMLAATLALITGKETKAPAQVPVQETLPYHRPGFGILLH